MPISTAMCCGVEIEGEQAAPRGGASGVRLMGQTVLPNGLRVLTTEMPHTRSATVSFYVGAGSRYERAEDAGISHFVEHACFKGSRSRPTPEEISEAIEGVGGVLNAGTDREMTVFYAKVPAAHLSLALDVVLDLTIRPIFEAEAFEKERGVILEELAMVEDQPGQLAELALDALLWPADPLGRDVAGTPETVDAITSESAAAYRRNQYTPANTLISVAGAFDAEAAVETVAALTSEWEFGEPDDWQRVGSSNGLPTAARVAVRNKPTEQANVMVGLPGIASEHPDRYALHLLTSVLGEGMSSRLFVELRERRGLAYDVQAYAAHLRDTGAVSIYLGVDPDNVSEAIALSLHELGRLREGVSDAELHKVREYTKGRMLLNLEDTRAVSAWYGSQTLLQDRARSVEEVVEKLEAVTQDDLTRVAADLLLEERLLLAVVGPFESAEPFEALLRF